MEGLTSFEQAAVWTVLGISILGIAYAFFLRGQILAQIWEVPPCGVRYLLISGQATILYGAATFSEDVDIWVEPDKDNIQRFVQARS